MNKKQPSPVLFVSTPKGISRTIRTMSQNSSSSSMKPKLPEFKPKVVDK